MTKKTTIEKNREERYIQDLDVYFTGLCNAYLRPISTFDKLRMQEQKHIVLEKLIKRIREREKRRYILIHKDNFCDECKQRLFTKVVE
jgi:hypothetical protein